MKQGHPYPLHTLACVLLALVLLSGLSILAGGFSPLAHAQPAATITVSTCDESHLDQAIASANSGDTITFGCSGDITLTQALSITKNLTLDGSGQNVTLDGNNSLGVLLISSGVSFTLNALTVAHGNAGLGGGLSNIGTGTVTISNSTFANNSASDDGGGLFNNDGTVTISNSTFANNSAGNFGGGLITFGGTVTISNSTFANNSAGNDGSGLTSSGTVTISNSIFANNTVGKGNCLIFGTFTDQGYNLSNDSSCGFTASTSQQNTDPKLDPSGLQNNGGPTQTIALQQGSPAIDLIPAAQCPATDQRGMSRPDNKETTCDSGAYEFQDDAPLTLTHFVAGPVGHRSAGVAATFTDADPTGQVSDYTATVSWGDGTTSTVKVIKNPFGQGFALGGSHTYARKGTYTLTLTVTDQGGSQLMKTVTVSVK